MPAERLAQEADTEVPTEEVKRSWLMGLRYLGTEALRVEAGRWQLGRHWGIEELLVLDLHRTAEMEG
jgi:hypothetical protein